MKVEFAECYVTLTCDPGDPKFYGVKFAKGEHALFRYLQRYLNARGNDFVKKLMWKDNHMMGEYQPYLRTRSPKSKGMHAMIWSGFFALRGANEDWNEGRVVLEVCFPWITDAEKKKQDAFWTVGAKLPWMKGATSGTE